jgi:undecaprenyl diphosphate synthase
MNPVTALTRLTHYSQSTRQLSPPADLTALPPDLERDRLPHHVACIMDGNGRWAQQRGLPRVAGHRQGAKTLKALVGCCQDWGIAMLTVYAFSTENWQRPPAEVNFLMGLLEQWLTQEQRALVRNQIRVRFLGDLQPLPLSLRRRIDQVTALTAQGARLTLNVAVNYGGRADITQACQQLAQQVQRGQLNPPDITETHIQQHLYTGEDAPPDLLIRTSGEQRLSNYLLWQLAYAELYFTKQPWPSFDRWAFYQALWTYQNRDRRFGGLS